MLALDMPSVVDLGLFHELEFTHDEEGHIIGGVVSHLSQKARFLSPTKVLPPGSKCGGSIWFDLPETRRYMHKHLNRSYQLWMITSWNPLNLEPSLLCHCSDHGRVVRGQWVPCS